MLDVNTDALDMFCTAATWLADCLLKVSVHDHTLHYIYLQPCYQKTDFIFLQGDGNFSNISSTFFYAKINPRSKLRAEASSMYVRSVYCSGKQCLLAVLLSLSWAMLVSACLCSVSCERALRTHSKLQRKLPRNQIDISWENTGRILFPNIKLFSKEYFVYN